MFGWVRQHIHRIRLTGRGAVLVMLAVFTLGLLAATWLRMPLLAGASFVAGSVAAAACTSPAALLTVTVTPPLLFCGALVGVKAVTATGNAALSVVEGTAITLAAVAPWLFAGMALSLAIAWARGLPGCVRDLRQQLRPDQRRPDRAASPAGKPR
jgi:hypothetical protein